MVKLFLYPLSWLYGIVVNIRNQLYDLNILKSKEFDLPVISIGNITVGGTGKTPHVEYLVNLLHEQFAVATLSRGYKRKTKGFRYVETNSTVLEVGDEPLQIKQKFPEVMVSVCENRVVGVEKLLQSDGEETPDVVLLDDAFQHRRITPGINILLIDYNKQIKDDSILPAGRLREGISEAIRANIIIFTKCPNEVKPIIRRNLKNDVALKPYQEIYFTSLDYQKLEPVFSAKKIGNDFYESNAYSGLIVTGIASPKLMQQYLIRFLKESETLAYRDHYNFSKDDIASIMRKFDGMLTEKKMIITTEKDAVRLKDREDLSNEFRNALYYLPIKVKFLEEEGKSFNKKIIDYVGENKRNRKLHIRKNNHFA